MCSQAGLKARQRTRPDGVRRQTGTRGGSSGGGWRATRVDAAKRVFLPTKAPTTIKVDPRVLQEQEAVQFQLVRKVARREQQLERLTGLWHEEQRVCAALRVVHGHRLRKKDQLLQLKDQERQEALAQVEQLQGQCEDLKEARANMEAQSIRHYNLYSDERERSQELQVQLESKGRELSQAKRLHAAKEQAQEQRMAEMAAEHEAALYTCRLEKAQTRALLQELQEGVYEGEVGLQEEQQHAQELEELRQENERLKGEVVELRARTTQQEEQQESVVREAERERTSHSELLKENQALTAELAGELIETQEKLEVAVQEIQLLKTKKKEQGELHVYISRMLQAGEQSDRLQKKVHQENERLLRLLHQRRQQEAQEGKDNVESLQMEEVPVARATVEEEADRKATTAAAQATAAPQCQQPLPPTATATPAAAPPKVAVASSSSSSHGREEKKEPATEQLLQRGTGMSDEWYWKAVADGDDALELAWDVLERVQTGADMAAFLATNGTYTREQMEPALKELQAYLWDLEYLKDAGRRNLKYKHNTQVELEEFERVEEELTARRRLRHEKEQKAPKPSSSPSSSSS